MVINDHLKTPRISLIWINSPYQNIFKRKNIPKAIINLLWFLLPESFPSTFKINEDVTPSESVMLFKIVIIDLIVYGNHAWKTVNDEWPSWQAMSEMQVNLP